jgi:fatty-acid desaturase
MLYRLAAKLSAPLQLQHGYRPGPEALQQWLVLAVSPESVSWIHYHRRHHLLALATTEQ